MDKAELLLPALDPVQSGRRPPPKSFRIHAFLSPTPPNATASKLSTPHQPSSKLCPAPCSESGVAACGTPLSRFQVEGLLPGTGGGEVEGLGIRLHGLSVVCN